MGSNYYGPFESDIKQSVIELSKKFMYTNIFHFDTEKGSILIEAELCSWVLKLFNPLPES